jgi:hypothetical protein
VSAGSGSLGKGREKEGLTIPQQQSTMKNGKNNTVSVNFSAAC